MKDRGHDALAAGLEWNSSETLIALFGWAEKITIAEESMIDAIPESYREKVSLEFCVGPDRWGMAAHPELWNDYIERVHKLIPEGPRKGQRFFT